MKTVYESSNKSNNFHVSLVKYRSLKNISHYHDDFELIYVNNGRASITVNGVQSVVRSGGCALIHSNDIHCIESSHETVISVLKLDASYFAELFLGKRVCSPLLSGEYRIEQVLDDIKNELDRPTEYGSTVADAMVTVLIARIMRGERTVADAFQSPNKQNTNELYDKIMRKMLSEYATLTFDEAAQYVHFSKPYFSKFFHTMFGMTFTEYLHTIRIAVAVDKIKKQEASITEISAQCGYNTIRNFNRVFKRITGYAPTELPRDYVFIINLHRSEGLDPTLNCTEIAEW